MGFIAVEFDITNYYKKIYNKNYVNNDMGTLISCVLQKNIDNEFIIEKEIFHRNLFKNKFSYNSY